MSEGSSTSDKALYFILGGFIGAAVALLFAPWSGEETRKLIATRARESADLMANRTRSVAEKTSSYVDRGKEILQQQRDQLSAAIDAGKQAYNEERDKAKI